MAPCCSPADFARHDVIGPDRAQADLRIAAATLPASALARIMLRTDSRPAQAAAARAELGIAVVQRPVGLEDPVLVPVLPEHDVGTIPIYLVTHRDLRYVPRIAATFDNLVDEFTRYARR